MLSYTSLLEPSIDDQNFLSTLVNCTLIGYPHEAVWLAFLEMVLLSRDAFAFQLDKSVLTFLKVAFMSPKWGVICDVLEREENSQLHLAVKDLINAILHDPI